MSKRLVWFTAGCIVGALGFRRWVRLRRAIRWGGIDRVIDNIVDRASIFLKVFRDGMTARERELRGVLDVDARPSSYQGREGKP